MIGRRKQIKMCELCGERRATTVKQFAFLEKDRVVGKRKVPCCRFCSESIESGFTAIIGMSNAELQDGLNKVER